MQPKNQPPADTAVPADFSGLSPDLMIDAVEAALDRPMLGFAQPLTSYINRVYELQAADGTRFIAKFYRPGRWSRQTLEDEHEFVLECQAEDIPVVAPLPLKNGRTLDQADGIYFAVYPKRRGREFDAAADEDWRRLGRLIGRVHAVGVRHPAPHRTVLHPAHSTKTDIQELLERHIVADRYRTPFQQITAGIIELITPQFAGLELIRVHGDCHRGNIMERPEEGLLLIDFDDMGMGPPMQDLWMLLPERTQHQHELDLIREGYEVFHEFDPRLLRLIEPLRAMRMLYFLAWCGRQTADPSFALNFPAWGNEAFWRREIHDLEEQLTHIREALD